MTQSPSTVSSSFRDLYGFNVSSVCSGHSSFVYRSTRLRTGSFRVTDSTFTAVTGRDWIWPMLKIDGSEEEGAEIVGRDSHDTPSALPCSRVRLKIMLYWYAERRRA